MEEYRKNVGIVVFNSRGRVLIGERRTIPGALQFPQGGVEDRETPEEAARRELFEETGIQITDPPAGRIDEWLRYDYPRHVHNPHPRYRGQKQQWFYFFWDGDLNGLPAPANPEFIRLLWSEPETVASSIVEFKREIYIRVCEEARRIISRYLARDEAT